MPDETFMLEPNPENIKFVAYTLAFNLVKADKPEKENIEVLRLLINGRSERRPRKNSRGCAPYFSI